MSEDTVELPADPRIKKLAHDIVADGNEYAVDYLIDFYKALSELEEDTTVGRSDLKVQAESDVPGQKWPDIIHELAKDGPINKTPKDRYSLPSDNGLRRRFAQRLLVDEQVNPRVVMAVGGWDSFAAIEPYLNAPSEDVIDEAFAEIREEF